MKRLALFLAAFGVLVAINTPASASDLSRFLQQLARQQEARHQQELHRQRVEREIAHDQALQLGITPREHAKLDALIEREALHDEIEHAASHGVITRPAPSCRLGPPRVQPILPPPHRGGHGHPSYRKPVHQSHHYRHSSPWGFGFQTPRGLSFHFNH